MPLADRLALKQVCACVAPPGSSFIHPAHPFHWYDAILPPVFNRPAGLSLQNVTVCPFLKFWEMQVFHHITALGSCSVGKWLRSCQCYCYQFWLIIEQLMKSRFACTMDANVIMIYFCCMPFQSWSMSQLEPWCGVGQSKKNQLSYIKISFCFYFLCCSYLLKSLITGTEMKSALGRIDSHRLVVRDYIVGPEARGLELRIGSWRPQINYSCAPTTWKQVVFLLLFVGVSCWLPYWQADTFFTAE